MKKSEKAQKFQTWLTRFRTTGVKSPVLLAKPDMTDEQLRKLWDEAMSVFNRKIKAPRKPKRS